MPPTWKVFDTKRKELDLICEGSTRLNALRKARAIIPDRDLLLVRGKTAELDTSGHYDYAWLYIAATCLLFLVLVDDARADFILVKDICYSFLASLRNMTHYDL